MLRQRKVQKKNNSSGNILFFENSKVQACVQKHLSKLNYNPQEAILWETKIKSQGQNAVTSVLMPSGSFKCSVGTW